MQTQTNHRQVTQINNKKWKLAKGDYDQSTWVREFTGRITHRRWKLIDSYCRTHTFHQRCHHDHDCCGCLCYQRMEFKHEFNQTVITLTFAYNY